MDKLTISWLLSIYRPYSNNPRKAYQNILSELFSVLTKGDYFLESTASSRIMNSEYDIPINVRDSVNLEDENCIFQRLVDFYKKDVNIATEDRLMELIKTEIVNSALSSAFKSTIESSSNAVQTLALLTIVAIRTDNRNLYRESLFDSGNCKVEIISGDIISMSFNKKHTNSFKIVVIPVDQKFTMEVGRSDGIGKISKDSLHGKWIMKMEKNNYSKKRISKMISYSEGNQNIKIGKIEIGNTWFWLLPISELNFEGKAVSSSSLIEEAINELLNEYDLRAQGAPIFIPFMGTGRARVFASLKESKALLTKVILEKAPKLNGNVFLVIHQKNLQKENI